MAIVTEQQIHSPAGSHDPEESGTAERTASHIRMVLLGKTGIGKSSFAQTLLGKEFEISHTADSETSKCQTKTNQAYGRTITITDTPGLFDSKMSEEELKTEIINCIVECSPGPHAFLILLKVERFTVQENEVISKIEEFFSEEAFKHAVVVFTHGDQLPHGMNIREFVGENEKLRDLLNKCGNRCHVIDNKYWNNNQQDEYRNNQVQVEALLNTIDTMIEANGGGCYTNEMLQEVERRIQEEEERIRLTAGNMSEEEIREQAKRKVREDLKKLTGVTVGMLLGALFGLPLMVAFVVKGVVKLIKCIKPATAGAGGNVSASSPVRVGVGAAGAHTAAAVGATAAAIITADAAVIGAGAGCVGIAAAAGAGIGAHRGFKEACKAGSANEAAKNTAKALCNQIEGPFKELMKTIQKRHRREETQSLLEN